MKWIIENLDSVLNIFQILLNSFAIIVAGFIVKNYISTLNEKSAVKEEQIKLLESSISFWKEKTASLEKKSPEYAEEILSKRIKIREEEIIRLNEDFENHTKEIHKKNEELQILKEDLQKARMISQSTKVMFNDFDDYFFSKEGQIETIELGTIIVESGQLMITDPCFIDTNWIKEKLNDIRIYRDVETNRIYQYLKDFENFQNIIEGFSKNVNELIAEKRLEELEIKTPRRYSYSGAGNATSSKEGYGSLELEDGTEGAAIAIRTIWGDGEYIIHGEKYDGRIIRVLISLV